MPQPTLRRTYIRGKSTIYVSFKDLFDAFKHFRGARVTSSDLQQFRPWVFDSSAVKPGHSCNCTFLFLVCERLGLSSRIRGRGVRGNPYYVDFADDKWLCIGKPMDRIIKLFRRDREPADEALDSSMVAWAS